MAVKAAELRDEFGSTVDRLLGELLDKAFLPLGLTEEVERQTDREKPGKDDCSHLHPLESTRLEFLVGTTRLEVATAPAPSPAIAGRKPPRTPNQATPAITARVMTRLEDISALRLLRRCRRAPADKPPTVLALAAFE